MASRIKSETIYRINHMPGEEIDLTGDIDSKLSHHEYDESGRLVIEIAFTQDGEVADKIKYRYDEEGRLLETLIFGDDDEILERKELVWLDKDRIGQEIIHYMDGSKDIHQFFYDDQGNITGIQVKDDDDETELTEKYFYDGDKIIRWEKWNGEDEMIFKQEDEYADGILKTRSIWSAEDGEPFTVVRHFNANGSRSEELRYDSRNKPVEHNRFEEDENGRLVRMVEENKQRKNTTEFSYDDHGNVIYQKETDMHGNLNHEIFRFYQPDGNPVKTVVEMEIKPSGDKRAYTLIYQRDFFKD